MSHALMYVDERDWPRVFAEFARVLQPGGVLRVTEDDTEDQRSSRLGGWRGSEPAVTQTSPARLWTALLEAGLAPHHVAADETRYVDASLCQAQHGKVPDVFFIEGVKPSGILFAPHHDDETLFAAFTLIRHRPRVVVCFPSAGDYGDTATRWAETVAAVRALGAVPHEGWMGDLSLGDQMRAIDRYEHPDVVWAPHPHASHPDHVAVAQMAETVFGDRVRWYHTYTEDGKVRQGQPVEHEPAWTRRKLDALACYRSQIGHPRANQFFMADLYEYEEPA